MDNYAIIIGINDYKTLNSLKGAINDANRFEEWVLKKGGVSEENCFKIISKNKPLKPIKDDIDNQIVSMINKISEGLTENENRLYFYFSGHGAGGKKTDTGLCLPHFSGIKQNPALSSNSYKESIKKLGYFKEIFFFLDCCRNYSRLLAFLTPNFLNFPNINANLENKNTDMFIAYSTKYDNAAYETTLDNNENGGIFTEVLLDVLNGKAADINGNISIKELKKHLEFEIPTYNQKPEINVRFENTESLVVSLKN